MMQPGGQSLVDRLLAAKNTIAGQTVAKVVCKATTEEIIGPKRKHLDVLLQATHEANVSIPEIADLLIERSQNSSWVVSFKSLITIHHLMTYGNERFQAYMASHNHSLQSDSYIDRTTLIGTDMSSYIRRYSTYLNEKREAYKLMGYDFCKIKRGKDDGLLRTMSIDKLLKALPILQNQLDALLQFEIVSSDLVNGIINSCFLLLIKDLLHLYAAYNEGMINLLEKYFDLNKKQCREGLELYKKYLDRTDRVAQYLKVAESNGLEQDEIPELSNPPNNLLETMENHLVNIEKKATSSIALPSKQLTEHDIKIFSQKILLNGNENTHKVIEDEAQTLAKFKKEQTKSSVENNFNTDDPFTETLPSNNQEKLFNNDIFSFIPTPAPKQDLFVENTQPISSKPKPNIKPLQSGDLDSSLNQLVDNLNIKDHSKIGKDHQWTANDKKNQQIIGLSTSDSVWSNSSAINQNVFANGWPTTSSTNPFAVPLIPTQINVNTNPFSSQSIFDGSIYRKQQEVNDPFGNL